MITQKCRACNATLSDNIWVDLIGDYNDLCTTCLMEINSRTIFNGEGDSATEFLKSINLN